MKLLKTFGSLTALSLAVVYNSLHAPLSYAAQLGLGDSLTEEPKSNAETAFSDVCAEESVVSPEALQESPSPLSQSLGPNLVASATISDVSIGIQSPQTLVAQGVQFEDCGIGGIAPEGGLPAAGFPLAAALIPAGAAAAIVPLAATGGDDNPGNANPPADTPPVLDLPNDDPENIPPNVPEPSEAATAGLFACLGIAGIVARRRMNRSH